MKALETENESLKAQLSEWLKQNGPGGWIDDLRAERDRALEVIREYREDKGSEHHYCRKEVRYPITGMHDDRCLICIKADALLKEKRRD